MVQYRCAICGSVNVTKQESNAGFSYKKALIGTAVFGTVGAVAGINGKNKIAYICSDCGSEMPYPMDRATKDMIDIVMTAPQYLAKTLPSSILDQYFNVKKEITRYLEAIDDTFISASNTMPSNPANIQENEFRAAAIDCRNFCGYYYDFKEGPLSRDRYAGLVQAIKSSHTLFFGLLAYSRLINPAARIDDDIAACFSPRKLIYPILYYILSISGPMTPYELFCYVHSDEIAKKVFGAVMEDAIRKCWVKYQNLTSYNKPTSISTLSEKEYATFWIYTLKDMLKVQPREPIFYNCRSSLSYDSQKQLYVGIKLLGDCLYIKNTVSEEEYLQENHPDWFANFKANRKEFEDITASLSTTPTCDDSALIASINTLKNENQKANESIDKLRKKIFGKKKALEEIELLTQTIAANSRKIQEREAALEQLRLEHKKQLLEAENIAKGRQKVLNNEYELLIKEKAVLLDKYPEWIEVEISA